jgi:hypothetical protein
MHLRFRTWRGLVAGALALGAALAFSGQPAAAADSVPAKAVTFAKDVAPIFQQKCQVCHQPDSVAPMSLITYEQSRPWAQSIKKRVMQRQMPPWHIDKTVGVQHFKNDMSLTDEQIDTIVRWVDGGSLRGDPKDMPPPVPLLGDNEWRAVKDGLGQPDFIVKSKPYKMPAHHQDVWWRPMTDIPVTEPSWVKAIEVRPSSLPGRRIMHHAVVYLAQDEDPESINTGIVTPTSFNNDDLSGRRSQLMEWAIGKGYDLYRPGTGKLLLPGSKVSWDIHIHAVGDEIEDSVEMGVWLYPKGEEPKHRTYLVPFYGMKIVGEKGRDNGLDIPPNTIAQNEGFTVLKQAAILENFQPHMHLRGKAMEVEAILPDGTTQIVSYVGNFNFNWMTNYIYADDAAPAFPKGTVIHVKTWHDNTAANKNNPDPNQWVGFGDRTVDEMAHAWINVTYLSDDEYKAWVAEHRKKTPSTTSQ